MKTNICAPHHHRHHRRRRCRCRRGGHLSRRRRRRLSRRRRRRRCCLGIWRFPSSSLSPIRANNKSVSGSEKAQKPSPNFCSGA